MRAQGALAGHSRSRALSTTDSSTVLYFRASMPPSHRLRLRNPRRRVLYSGTTLGPWNHYAGRPSQVDYWRVTQESRGT